MFIFWQGYGESNSGLLDENQLSWPLDDSPKKVINVCIGIWSGTRDSNSQPHAPKACALANCASSRLCCKIMVGVRGVEPRTSSLSETRSNQLSYTPKFKKITLNLERVMGVEPTTICLEGRNSSQLSYTRKLNVNTLYKNFA